MQLKTTCQSCKSELLISQDEIFEDIYMKRGSTVDELLLWYEFKKGGLFRLSKTRDAVQHYKLLQDIKLKYFICLCGEKNYLKKIDTEWIFKNYKTEKMNLELLEWKTDHDDYL